MVDDFNRFMAHFGHIQQQKEQLKQEKSPCKGQKPTRHSHQRPVKLRVCIGRRYPRRHMCSFTGQKNPLYAHSDHDATDHHAVLLGYPPSELTAGI
ncbi:hypothetical protein J7T55_009946 [Diaporthe amygdali]|uniref:uncharacterized protein n=1 Tax=Phomopsis amygdali TaxID=1214568 RepID=UPI0022FEBD95|nr:uncharacterized protein J7T55_009946 [Diaporthe amygdali]KAJ0116795.1 hypothetical protein J7T55_009946 [Diaporthe amygdali]